MKTSLLALFLSVLGLMNPGIAWADDIPHFEYICSVYVKNKDGLFREVINVVFMPEWQKKSLLYKDEQTEIWFEITPLLDFKGDVEGHEMQIRRHLRGDEKPQFILHGTEFSEIAFEDQALNLGTRCFHRSQRGQQ